MPLRIIGREPELSFLERFIEGETAGALLLSGDPGMGKTTLWEAGVARAEERALRVLSARPSDVEMQLSFSALIDLFEDVDAAELTGIPVPQLRALEVALLRRDPSGNSPELQAIATGFLGGLRALTADGPVLVAVDDIQWLDGPSAEVITFAARRLEAEAVKLLLARRSGGDPTALERVLHRRGRLERVPIGPLSLGATRRIIFERLGLSLPRRTIRRIFESSLGNPLFALELGRAIGEGGVSDADEEIALPNEVADLLGARVDALPAATRRVLLAVALATDLRHAQLAAIVDQADIDDAVDSGVVVLDGDRVRASHPLLAAAALGHSLAGERRKLHLDLSVAVTGDGLRARHLALATVRPDAELAATLTTAAETASARGAAREAVELAEHALRLTAPGTPERGGRLLTLAGYLEVAGEQQRVTDLLAPELESFPPGVARARAELLLSEGGGVTHADQHLGHLERALEQAGPDAELKAAALARKAISGTIIRVERIEEADRWGEEALALSAAAGPDVERLALQGLGWARALGGRPIDDLRDRSRDVSESAIHIIASLERLAAVRLTWRGEVDAARSILTELLELTDARGESWAYIVISLHLCELALRAGDLDAATRFVEEWRQSAERDLFVGPTFERCHALLAACRGQPEEAQRWGSKALAGAEATGATWQLLETQRALGLAALFALQHADAVAHLLPVWDHAEREGIGDPGAFPVAPDLVEALVTLDELDRASEITERLGQLAEDQEHPWGLATAARCAALIALTAEAFDEEAAGALEAAAERYGTLGLRFDRARSLLSLGRAQRRRRKWGGARRSLEGAAEGFDAIGAGGWAEQARAELARVGGRRGQSAGVLTEAERRAAELAAEGLSNKEIARALFVTVRTVEVHLSRAYAKLGIQSRVQLARALEAAAGKH
ncbi:MAG TPA: AAA family ATPase [Actinomycetota bacterium]